MHPDGDPEFDERLEVLRRRYAEARKAGLSMVEARIFSESGEDIGTLRKLVEKGCEPRLIARVLL
jgi:hypothetical protein